MASISTRHSLDKARTAGQQEATFSTAFTITLHLLVCQHYICSFYTLLPTETCGQQQQQQQPNKLRKLLLSTFCIKIPYCSQPSSHVPGLCRLYSECKLWSSFNKGQWLFTQCMFTRFSKQEEPVFTSIYQSIMCQPKAFFFTFSHDCILKGNTVSPDLLTFLKH